MDLSNLTKLALPAAILFAAYKWGPTPVKAMALGVAGTLVARQIPVLQDVV